ncbi:MULTISPECIES: hypothetical protein [Nocardia]|uniref:Uncharacterized protein n=1 Tax=Nocardia sputorum TaxID=2984338 RepID=A0ABM8D119_9NOCA|nr:hypothetical protein [Nocardia sputorum]BDU01022.1 hypothetical protein IFM12276_40500 [Nocardia sputorum]
MDLAVLPCARDPSRRRDPQLVAQVLAHHHVDGWSPTRIAREINKGLPAKVVIVAHYWDIETEPTNGLLTAVTRNVIQAALDAETTEHLGYARVTGLRRPRPVATTTAMAPAAKPCTPISARPP